MRGTLRLTTPPDTSKPAVPLELARLYHRVDSGTPDGVLIDLLVASRADDAQAFIGRALITQTFTLYMNGFPGSGSVGAGMGGFAGIGIPWAGYEYPYASAADPCSPEIELFYPPIQAVNSITYIDTDGATQVLSPPLYGGIAQVNLKAEPGLIRPMPGQRWPQTLANTYNTVAVEYKAGYGDTNASIPAGIQEGILSLIGAGYEYREPFVVVRGGAVELPFTAIHSLSKFRLPYTMVPT